MMDLFVLRYILLHGFLHVSMATQCSLLQNCAIQLKNLLNHTLDSEIQLCLNVVGKQSELQNCETQAVTTCALGGHEPEYIEYQMQKFAANQKCLEECPNMDEVKICQDKIKYDIIQTSGYSQFCSNYNDQTKCVEEKLKLCSFRIKLFESGLSEDVRRIVRTVCSSGCSSIDTTMKSIDACNKQFSITSKDNSFTDCSSYKEYINCIQKDSPCPEFRRVAQYSQPSLLQAQNKCEPTTTSSTAAPATRPTDTTTTNVGLQRNQSERHDVSCNSDSMSVFIPSTLLSQNETLSWRDPHCTVTNNGTHYVSVVSHTACGTTVKFTDSEVIFENDLIIRQSTSLPVSSHNDIVDFGGAYSEIIPVKCVYPRRQNVTTAYIPAQTRVRFFEKRYGHMDVELEQYHSDKFDTVIRDITYPREVPINQDMYIKLHTIHNSSDIAIKVDSCVATPSIMPADGQLYPLIDHGCPASPAVKLYPSAFNEVKFSVHAFEFKSSPGSVVYIHCQISVCLAKNPQCVVGCRSRQRREVSAADDSSHLVSGGPYLLVAEQGSVQMATIVAAVCACLAVVATIVAAVGWRRKLNAPKHDSKLISD